MTDDVSRETSTPSVPPAARRVFASDRLPLAERYAELLATDGVVRGLIGPREAPRLWDRHVLNCAVLGEWIDEGVEVCDIGSGAGLPGIVLAIARPDLCVTLVEPLLRRTTFLTEVVEELGLDTVTVVRGRADSLHGERRFDVVTSRAVAPLGRLLEWSMPLVAPEGALVAMKGSSVVEEIAEARPVLEALGCAEPVIRELGTGVLEETTGAVRVSWADPAAVSWPPAARSNRGSGAPAARSAKARRRGRPRPAR
ncbi:16S rRNA (guanine(527)-N(7))-methyltransferase RsmG [Nocardioides sp. zg-579]|uniref:Ribosomal RNA small subunit methyltransferase G n=1 Tax=Nocardioides marmotae TaxID=2663857 RepID=A0A6I3JDU8_9ACTN|nr:16S rRNA (guanine(527)-N(7))-methyltransferase RsmG [Nocardioides marmotae]MCR6032633.1 16S rRNA (guanine(527)-N(7))-methyltransferase RsmG [Gordonia jinghuaiqii]MTB96281.1 16S rRNA (guanine(527)-N(7))-methyltransferase RsmG [Nocardioides marmotae]QKE03228.1 16S rRNA (guanine(527)-N(7))-methyltransferase RsmG [Nocardioides marmotae]